MIARRLAAQLLSGRPATSPEAVGQRLLAVQAQDPRGARLAVRSRSVGLRAADVDAALTDRKSMVVTWLNRGTLHLVCSEDYWWLHPLTTPQIATGNHRRLRQEGLSDKQADQGVEVIAEAVSLHGPQTRDELRRRLDQAGVPTAGQALVHLLAAATVRGDIVRGPMLGAEQAFVAASDWLGAAPPAIERPDALARLGRRYLDGHGPADARDLAKWAGITLGDARAAFASIRDELVDRPGDLLDLGDRTRAASLPPPRLLGPFDPLLLGWVSREPVVGVHKVTTSNGLFRACALVDGRVVGLWGLRGTTLTVTLREPVKRAMVEALRADADDVLRFLDRTVRSKVVIETST